MKNTATSLVVLLFGLACASCSSTPVVESLVTQTAPVTQATPEPVESECPDNPHCPADAIRCVCDARDNVILEDLDPDEDGEIDQRNTYTHDENGNILTKDMDYGATGRVYMHCVFNPPCAPGAQCMPPSCTSP